ncbi:MAG: hypothetical protein QOG77_913 [Solirubrobacteraceae bacterium]|jgi:hypothetical protein|nr:hypothetical protein [Solirubrobacteraceae bacterium]
MWVPTTAAELEGRVGAGELSEHAGLEAKQEIAGNTFKVARAVAAMATAGGIIVYGVAEDEHGRLARLAPIDLHGAAERVDSIVRDGVREAPTIRMVALERNDDPGRGYLVVVVPPSPRAPHMVILNGDNRFYGRSATATRPLEEYEVRLLYERQTRQGRDLDALLEATVAWAGLLASDLSADMHAFAEPAVLDDELWARAAAGSNRQAFAEELRTSALTLPRLVPGGARDVRSNYMQSSAFGGSAWRWHHASAPEKFAAAGDQRQSRTDLLCEIATTGAGRLFCVIGERYTPGNVAPAIERLYLWPEIAVDNLVGFLAMLGELYRRVPYYATVNLGVQLRGLAGGAYETERRFRTEPYEADIERRVMQRSAIELIDRPAAVATDLLRPFLDRLLGEGADPFAEAGTGRT